MFVCRWPGRPALLYASPSFTLRRRLPAASHGANCNPTGRTAGRACMPPPPPPPRSMTAPDGDMVIYVGRGVWSQEVDLSSLGVASIYGSPLPILHGCLPRRSNPGGATPGCGLSVQKGPRHYCACISAVWYRRRRRSAKGCPSSAAAPPDYVEEPWHADAHGAPT